MSDMIAKSPKEWMYALENIKSSLMHELENIKRIYVVKRCENCFKKTSKVEVLFKKNSLVIKSWTYSCNMDKETNHEMIIKPFDKNLLFLHLNEDKFGFSLSLDYYAGANIQIPLTDVFSLNDYEVHGEYVYKDRNLRIRERSVDNGVVLMLQNFIDFKGLRPMYNQTIYIEF